MDISISLVDLNARLVSEWRDAFAGEPDVAVVHGSMLLQRADAWVTPTNARGSMDGGFDAAVKRVLRRRHRAARPPRDPRASAARRRSAARRA